MRFYSNIQNICFSAPVSQIRRCLDELWQCGDILEEFDLDLWNSMIESVTVCADEKLVFLFRDGTEVTVQMPEKPKMTKTT